MNQSAAGAAGAPPRHGPTIRSTHFVHYQASTIKQRAARPTETARTDLPAPTTAIMPSSLAAGAFDCVDAAVILQNHDPAAVRRVARFCNGLFISLAPNLGRGSNFVFVAEKNEAVKRHSVLPTFLAARGRIRAKV